MAPAGPAPAAAAAAALAAPAPGDDGCYNHLGRFFWTDSDNAGLSMPMSSTWKTYTFCFDRDLFPKWLPSNLSAEQRRNFSKNFLKFQVDFNKSLDVANNAINAKEAKLHNVSDPFDLWLDDVEIITDEALCTNYPVTSSWKPISKAGGSCAIAPDAAMGTSMLCTRTGRRTSSRAVA